MGYAHLRCINVYTKGQNQNEDNNDEFGLEELTVDDLKMNWEDVASELVEQNNF